MIASKKPSDPKIAESRSNAKKRLIELVTFVLKKADEDISSGKLEPNEHRTLSVHKTQLEPAQNMILLSTDSLEEELDQVELLAAAYNLVSSSFTIGHREVSNPTLERIEKKIRQAKTAPARAKRLDNNKDIVDMKENVSVRIAIEHLKKHANEVFNPGSLIKSILYKIEMESKTKLSEGIIRKYLKKSPEVMWLIDDGSSK
jgi:hypothetical protein